MNPFRRKNRGDEASKKDEVNVPKPFTLEPKNSATVELVNEGTNSTLTVQTGKTRPEYELRGDSTTGSAPVIPAQPRVVEVASTVAPIVAPTVAATVASTVAEAAPQPKAATVAAAAIKPPATPAAESTHVRLPPPGNEFTGQGVTATSRPKRLSSDVKPVISVRAVKKIYQMGDIEVQALRGVDLDIFPGEIMAIMGPSGSGKSTLMNLLGCLDVPSEGTYLLDGVDVRQLNDNQLAAIRSHKIGFVFQSYNLLSRTSALANVELPLLYSGAPGRERRQRAKESLTLVGLGERLDHRPNELSGGQQQRVAIARALINRPAMILADEPTGNLDSKTRVEIMKLFQRLNRDQGMTIVFVTHDPETADYCERVVWIRDGVIARDDRHKIVAGIYAEGNESYVPEPVVIAAPAAVETAPAAVETAPAASQVQAVVPPIVTTPVEEAKVELPIL